MNHWYFFPIWPIAVNNLCQKIEYWWKKPSKSHFENKITNVAYLYKNVVNVVNYALFATKAQITNSTKDELSDVYSIKCVCQDELTNHTPVPVMYHKRAPFTYWSQSARISFMIYQNQSLWICFFLICMPFFSQSDMYVHLTIYMYFGFRKCNKLFSTKFLGNKFWSNHCMEINKSKLDHWHTKI